MNLREQSKLLDFGKFERYFGIRNRYTLSSHTTGRQAMANKKGKTVRKIQTRKSPAVKKPAVSNRSRKSGRESISARVNRLFEKWDKPDSPGAALSVIQNGSIIYKRGYGCANLEYDIPITPASIFHVASVSKQFTAFAITVLAHQGNLSLDDEIQKHLPELPDFGNPITIRHLIHHTSGLRDQWELLMMAGWRLDDVITRAHILKLACRQKDLNFDPGAEHLYCNTGYTLMAEIVERITGQSFRQWTEANIFKPLKMSSTHFHDDHEMIVPNRTYSYAPAEDGEFRKSVLNYANVGATSLFTTVEDLAKWVQNFSDGRIGGKPVIQQMHQRGVLNSRKEIDYAFGLSIGQYRGLKIVGHGGSDAGYRSHLLQFPDQAFAVAVLSNLASFAPHELAHQVVDIYLADRFTPLEPFAGDYLSEELNTTYSLTVQDNQLIVRHIRREDIPLRHSGTDRFQSENGWLKLGFTRNSRKRITGFLLTGGRVRNLRFDKQS